MKKLIILSMLALVGLTSFSQTKFDCVEINGKSGEMWLPNGKIFLAGGVDGKVFFRHETAEMNYVGFGIYGEYANSATTYDTSATINDVINFGLDLRLAGKASFLFNYTSDVWVAYSIANKTSKVTYVANDFSSLEYSYIRLLKSDAINFGAAITLFKDRNDLLPVENRFPYSFSIGVNAYNHLTSNVLLTKVSYDDNNAINTIDTLVPTPQIDEIYSLVGDINIGISPYSFPIKGRNSTNFGISPLDMKISYGYTNSFKFQPGFIFEIGPTIDDYSRFGKIISLKMTYANNSNVSAVGIMGTVSVIRLIDLIEARD